MPDTVEPFIFDTSDLEQYMSEKAGCLFLCNLFPTFHLKRHLIRFSCNLRYNRPRPFFALRSVFVC